MPLSSLMSSRPLLALGECTPGLVCVCLAVICQALHQQCVGMGCTGHCDAPAEDCDVCFHECLCVCTLCDLVYLSVCLSSFSTPSNILYKYITHHHHRHHNHNLLNLIKLGGASRARLPVGPLPGGEAQGAAALEQCLQEHPEQRQGHPD